MPGLQDEWVACGHESQKRQVQYCLLSDRCKRADAVAHLHNALAPYEHWKTGHVEAKSGYHRTSYSTNNLWQDEQVW